MVEYSVGMETRGIAIVPVYFVIMFTTANDRRKVAAMPICNNIAPGES